MKSFELTGVLRTELGKKPSKAVQFLALFMVEKKIFTLR